MYAVCDSCGQSYRQPVKKSELPIAGNTLVVGNEDTLVTPCCRTSDWSSTLRPK